MVPYVSVVVPTYNSASFIIDTLSSVVNNGFQDVEIIVVDDGSSDQTVEIVKNHPSDIKLITQQNSGRGASRNKGVGQAKGKYIAFLDHDDLLTQGSIAARVEFLDSNQDIGWVFTDAIEFDHSGDLGLFLDQFPWLDLAHDHFSQLLKGCFPLTSTIMIRSDLIRQVGGFNAAIDYGDDLELFLRLFLVSTVGMIRKPLTRRRIHPTQGVSSTFDRWDSRVKIYSNFKPLVGIMNEQQVKVLKLALKFSYFKLGECYWEQNDFSTACRMFFNSLGFSPHSVKAIMYATICLAPGNFIVTLRKIKNILVKANV